MIHAAEAWAKECNRQGPLAGIPVSLKDMIGVAGFDTNHAYSAWSGNPAQKDSPHVRLLRDAGAVPFVKTTVPITLMSGETYSDLFGRTTNPTSRRTVAVVPLAGKVRCLAYGGSRIGLGSDVAGSVRIPAHFSGVYSIKSSLGRFIGQAGPGSYCLYEALGVRFLVPSHALERFQVGETAEVGVMWDDGVVSPSPACKRALETVVEVLQRHGHEVASINPPSPYEGLKIASQLLIADGGKEALGPVRTGETMDAGYARALRAAKLPRWLRRLFVWYVRYIKRDDLEMITGDAGLKMWEKEGIDFILTVPNPLPAVPHNGMDHGFKALNYTLLFNLLDYTAGVLPVTHVDSVKDKLPGSPRFKPRNCIEKVVYKMYDSAAMHGLPLGVQVVGDDWRRKRCWLG
ncbi:putative amidase signature enzyme [Lyophyllum shimeji]|uniref:Amidase signature enzyme n=1 Tax=Lyophyllum shimeji TaxID=47721 RepID=A0A9P3PN87_LYOSH|nr:putative amidase signature enzyme [Lyophyllum shimeji]